MADRQGAGVFAAPGRAAEPDRAAAGRAPGEVLADAPLMAPPDRPGPVALSGPAPKLGASAWVPLVSTDEPTSTKAARSGGTATVTAVSEATAASPAPSRSHVRPCDRATSRKDRDVAPGTSQSDISGRHPRPHHAAARRLVAATRAISLADRHSPVRQ